DVPFGLVSVEALLSGTPVLGTRRGALPELVTPAVGALCDTMDEIIAAAEQIQSRDPGACRAHAERFFTHLVMAGEYLRMYRHVLETGTPPAGSHSPTTSNGRSSIPAASRSLWMRCERWGTDPPT